MILKPVEDDGAREEGESTTSKRKEEESSGECFRSVEEWGRGIFYEG